MIHKEFFRRFLVGFCVPGFSALLFGLSRYSYRAKELLVCWFFFCSLFAVLALILFGAVLATFAGQYFLKWLSIVKLIIPDLAAALAAAPQQPVCAPQISVAGSLEFSVAPCMPVVAIDSAAYLLIDPVPLSEKPFSGLDVPN
jgi:hypothetical protein